MSTYNIQFHDKIRKKIPKYYFLELLEGFCRESTTVNEPSGFEPLRLYCILVK